MFRQQIWLAIGIACVATQTLVAELLESDQLLLAKALKDPPPLSASECTYTQTMIGPLEDEPDTITTRVASVSVKPEGELSSTLVSVDGREPTAKELADFEPVTNSAMDSSFDYIDIDRLEFAEQTGSVRTFKGKLPKSDFIQAGMEKRLVLYLDVDTSTATVKSMRLTAPKPFRHKLIAKFQSFDQSFTFTNVQELNRLVLTDMSMSMKMKILVKAVEVVFDAKFSDFDCAA